MIILVTGVSSSPGYKVAVTLAKRKTNVIGQYYRNPIYINGILTIKKNLVKQSHNLIKDFKPDILIHIAALGDVDICEEKKELCYKINVLATGELLEAAYKLGTKIIFLSTDYVFDGSKGMYKEEDKPSPLNYYGLTKLIGEKKVLSLEGIVVRTSGIYGIGPGRTNFGKIVIQKLSRGEIIYAFSDQWLSPTLNSLLGEAIAKLALDINFSGIIHVAGPRLSRYEFAKKIAEAFNLNSELIRLALMRRVNFKAKRPQDSSLNSTLAQKLLNIRLNDIDYALSILKREFKNDNRYL